MTDRFGGKGDLGQLEPWGEQEVLPSLCLTLRPRGPWSCPQYPALPPYKGAVLFCTMGRLISQQVQVEWGESGWSRVTAGVTAAARPLHRPRCPPPGGAHPRSLSGQYGGH